MNNFLWSVKIADNLAVFHHKDPLCLLRMIRYFKENCALGKIYKNFCRKINNFTLIESRTGNIGFIKRTNLLASRRSANGASAVETMRVLYSAEITYQAGVGAGNFGLTSNLNSQQLIDDVVFAAAQSGGIGGLGTAGDGGLGGTPKSGYLFGLNIQLAGNGQQSLFEAVALPAGKTGVARTGDRAFFVDTSGVIRTTNAPTEIPKIASTPLGN